MGSWGPGLYSSDFAEDLSPALTTLCKLPLSGDEIVDLLAAREPEAQTPDDEDYTTFWLVLADQLHRRGIESRATRIALDIIDTGTDVDIQRAAGMSDADLRSRQRMLSKLHDTLSSPCTRARSKTRAEPQPFLLTMGNVVVFPMDAHGKAANPYWDDGFVATSWGAFVVVATGHAFGYLAWYEIARDWPVEQAAKPTLEEALHMIEPRPQARLRLRDQHEAGAPSGTHLRRLRLEVIGTTDRLPSPRTEPRERERVAIYGLSLERLLKRPPDSRR